MMDPGVKRMIIRKKMSIVRFFVFIISHSLVVLIRYL